MSERMRRCFALRRHDTLVVLFGKIYRKGGGRVIGYKLEVIGRRGGRDAAR